MYRKTYAEINLKNIFENTKKIIKYLHAYEYHIGVVKADCYGHDGIKVVNAIIEGGCNYLAVATLEEALEIRKYNANIPILCLGPINNEYLKVCIENKVTITITNYDYLLSLDINKLNNLKVHLKINTGMNRLGINNADEFIKVYNYLKTNNVYIEGLYTHVYNDSNKDDTLGQIEVFENIVKDINLDNIPIVHFGASGYSLNYPKKSYVNGCRFGIAIYGLIDNNLELESTFSLSSTIIQINDLKQGVVGYGGNYKINGNERIAVVPTGYADGVIRKNTGRSVYINDKAYPIVGNICMDMLFVKVDESIKVGDKVIIIKDNNHIKEIARHLDTITYEVICSIGKRIPRVYIDK